MAGYQTEKGAPTNIVKVTSYKPFIAIDEDGDVIFDDEALKLDSYSIVSTEDPKVKEYAATMSRVEMDGMIKRHYSFISPTESTIFSLYMPQILAYCLKGTLISMYNTERTSLRDQSLAKRILDVLKRYVAARVVMDEEIRKRGQGHKLQRAFIYFGGAQIPKYTVCSVTHQSPS
jgi:hypothetical protein